MRLYRNRLIPKEQKVRIIIVAFP